MSRKEASFRQLFDYMESGAEIQDRNKYCFYHNFYFQDKEKVLFEFESNSKHIKNSLGSNYLYHEVLSFSRSKNNVSEEKQKETLLKVVQQYVQARANNHLACGFLHNEKDNNIHFHLMISANEVGSNKRKRLTTKDFSEIKKHTEQYLLRNYPELGLNNDISKNAQEILAEELKAIFALCKSKNEFEAQLENSGINYKLRGKTVTFARENSKGVHRAKKLGIDKEFWEMNKRFSEINIDEKKELKEKIEIVFSRSKNKEELELLLEGVDVELIQSKEKGIFFKCNISGKLYKASSLQLLGSYKKLQERFQSFQSEDTEKEIEKVKFAMNNSTSTSELYELLGETRLLSKDNIPHVYLKSNNEQISLQDLKLDTDYLHFLGRIEGEKQRKLNDISDTISNIFAISENKQDFFSKLNASNFFISTSDSIPTLKIKGQYQSYSLEDLGVLERYSGMFERFSKNEKNKRFKDTVKEFVFGDFSSRDKRIKKEKFKKVNEENNSVKDWKDLSKTEKTQETLQEWLAGNFENRDKRTAKEKAKERLQKYREEQEQHSSQSQGNRQKK